MERVVEKLKEMCRIHNGRLREDIFDRTASCIFETDMGEVKVNLMRDSRGDLFAMVLAPNANLKLENIRDIIPDRGMLITDHSRIVITPKADRKIWGSIQ